MAYQWYCTVQSETCCLCKAKDLFSRDVASSWWIKQDQSSACPFPMHNSLPSVFPLCGAFPECIITSLCPLWRWAESASSTSLVLHERREIWIASGRLEILLDIERLLKYIYRFSFFNEVTRFLSDLSRASTPEKGGGSDEKPCRWGLLASSTLLSNATGGIILFFLVVSKKSWIRNILLSRWI